MSTDPYLGDIQAFAFDFAPRDWALCNGQLLPINDNQALFSILGTTYGGNGTTNFALPDLRGRAPIHPGSGIDLGENVGAESVTLTRAQAGDGLAVAAQPTTTRPTGATPAVGGAYASPATSSTAPIGGGQAHENRQPYAVLNYCICIDGIFPSRP